MHLSFRMFILIKIIPFASSYPPKKYNESILKHQTFSFLERFAGTIRCVLFSFDLIFFLFRKIASIYSVNRILLYWKLFFSNNLGQKHF